MNHSPLYLVRHGEAAASWGQDADPPLSERGHGEAAAAARVLLELDVPPQHVVSSPLRRAQETARPLQDALALPTRVDGAFREIPAPVPLQERQDWLRAFMKQRWAEQGDELIAWRARIMDALGALPAHSVVFTHFLVINAVVGHLQARDETLVFWPANASITTLSIEDDGLRVAELGASMRSRVN